LSVAWDEGLDWPGLPPLDGDRSADACVVGARPLCAQTAPGVFAVGGYSGTGNLVGPATARAAVALALDGTPPPAWIDRTGVR
jgi:glycine/D-amino acid oxidase-like deaminating enzyme